jgi:hypothetical protein
VLVLESNETDCIRNENIVLTRTLVIVIIVGLGE